MSAFQPDMYVQIDVKEITENHVVCNLYTGVLCCKMMISRSDYDEITMSLYGRNFSSAMEKAKIRQVFGIQLKLISSPTDN